MKQQEIQIEGTKVREMFGTIAERYDFTNSVLSLGIHHLWRQTLVNMAPVLSDGLALDVCTGTGDLLPLLQKRFGASIGLDFSFRMLASGLSEHRERKEGGLVPRIQGDALSLPFDNEAFDIVSVAFGVRNFEDRTRGLTELVRVIKPGGYLLVLEFGQPRAAWFNYIYQQYSRYLMPKIGGMLTGNKSAYEYLPGTASEFPCGDEFLKMLGAAGLSNAHSKALTMGIAYAYCGQKL